MKFALGKLLFKFGPSNRTRYFCEYNQSTTVILSSCATYGKFWLKSLLTVISKTPKFRVNGFKSANPAQIALHSTRSGTSGALASKLNAESPKWKTLLNQVISKCTTDSWAAELRRNAAKRLMFGTGSTFALLGFTLAKEPTLLTNKDQLDVICQEIREAFNATHSVGKETLFKNVANLSVNDLDLKEVLDKGCNAVVYSGKWKESESSSNEVLTQGGDFGGYNLAVKMMFNYDAESNASTIWKAMFRESVPAQAGCLPEGQPSFWMQSLFQLPPHPNIVDMKCAFVDSVPDLSEGISVYPDALPTRLNERGSGRNMTFFLVMKRYNCTLRSYLQQKEATSRTRLILLSQLIEGLLFLLKNGVSHRDLKTDNILLDLSYGDESPLLVLTDFGCCLADKNHGLKLPFQSDEVLRGGNAALMAPEVVCAIPGWNSVIDYTKADLWAAGAIAYEIFGAKNPFYETSAPFHLVNHSYDDHNLPSLPPAYPTVMSKLVKDMLTKDPKKRIDVNEAANVCQILLHAPTHWLKNENSDPGDEFNPEITDQEIILWILAMGGVTLYNQNDPLTEVNPIEQMLRSLFFTRINFNYVKDSLNYVSKM